MEAYQFYVGPHRVSWVGSVAVAPGLPMITERRTKPQRKSSVCGARPQHPACGFLLGLGVRWFSFLLSWILHDENW